MVLKNLATLTTSELNSFLASFDNVLCDCDGVLWKLNKPIDGARESLAEIREFGKRVYFVSNNGTMKKEDFHKKMENFQLSAHKDDIAYPTLAVIDYLRSIKYNKQIFTLTWPAMRQELEEAGFKVISTTMDVIEERLDELPKHLQDNTEVGAVVVDVDVNINYLKLMQAALYLTRPEVLFIIGGTDTKIPVGLSIPIIGPGHFRNILEDLTGRSAIAFGKPTEHFSEFVKKKFNIEDPSKTLFIGDSLEQDMKFATKSGFQKLLVLTGLTTADQLEKCTDEDMLPNYYLDSLGDFLPLMKDKAII